MMLMFFIDRVFLARLSLDALAASMQTSMMNWTIASLGIGTVSYVNSFVAQYVGAGRKDRAAQSVWQGFYAAVGMAALTLVLAWYCRLVIPHFGHAPDVQRLERIYFSLLCLAAVPSILSTTFWSFYSGRGKTFTILWVNVSILILNVILDYGMIFGHGPFPKMGIRGAGLATLISTSSGLAIYLLLLSRRSERREFQFWRNARFDRELFGRLLRYGLPNGFQMLGDALAFTLFLLFVGRLGRDEQAATNLAFNLNALVFVPLLGLGTAVTILVGRRIGEGRVELAVRTTWLAFKSATAFVSLFAVIYLTIPDIILEPFRSPEHPADLDRIAPMVKQLLIFVTLYSLSDAMAVVFGAAIRSAGDTRFSFAMTAVSGWCLMVAPVLIAERLEVLTLRLCWIACSAHIIFLGAGFLARFLQGRWKTMKVIEDFAEELVLPPIAEQPLEGAALESAAAPE